MKLTTSKLAPYMRAAKFLYQNRKVEIALLTAVIALGREVVQAATGH